MLYCICEIWYRPCALPSSQKPNRWKKVIGIDLWRTPSLRLRTWYCFCGRNSIPRVPECTFGLSWGGPESNRSRGVWLQCTKFVHHSFNFIWYDHASELSSVHLNPLRLHHETSEQTPTGYLHWRTLGLREICQTWPVWSYNESVQAVDQLHDPVIQHILEEIYLKQSFYMSRISENSALDVIFFRLINVYQTHRWLCLLLNMWYLKYLVAWWHESSCVCSALQKVVMVHSFKKKNEMKFTSEGAKIRLLFIIQWPQHPT